MPAEPIAAAPASHADDATSFSGSEGWHPLGAADLPGSVTFGAGRGGLPTVRVDSAAGVAEVYLQGAHVASWVPRGQAPVLWMSAESRFEPGVPIRGGVPICFPWFGVHPDGPQHGLVRTLDWMLADAVDDGSTVRLTFVLRDTEWTWESAWPHEFEARYVVSVGATLGLSLAVTNLSAGAVSFEEALHTYFSVGDVRSISVTGLEGLPYTEASGSGNHDDGPLRLDAAITRTVAGAATAAIVDPALARVVRVDRARAANTVVWNPWSAQAATMPDFGDEEWQSMLCVETGNVGDARVRLAAGSTHEFSTTISVAPLG